MVATIDLTGHRALVTGGTRNIGRSMAVSLAKAGADVAVIGASNQHNLDAVVQEIRDTGVSGYGRLVDVGDWNALVDALEHIRSEFGPVDILINNVAIRPAVALEEVTEALWDRVFAVNVRSAFQCIQWALSGMMAAGWGRIINVSGGDAVAGSYGRVPSTTSKAAILGLTAGIAPMCARRGVTVNTLMPGPTNTERHTEAWYPHTQRYFEFAAERLLFGRLAEIREISDIAVFLASDMASWLTGQTIMAVGGFPLVRRPELE